MVRAALPYPLPAGRFHLMRYLLIFLALTACTGVHRAKRLKRYLSPGEAVVSLSPGGNDSVVFHYTGCGGFLLRHGNDVVLNDPFFSNRGPISLLSFRRLRTDTARVNRFFRAVLPGSRTDDRGIIKALLVGHSHYDHFLDVPYIYHTWVNKDSTLMIGNEGTKRLMTLSGQAYGAKVNEGAMLAVDGEASDAERLNRWFYTPNGRIRILPIRSAHAPQFKHLSLYTGAFAEDLHHLPKRARGWKEGATFSFLIDFLSGGHRPVFRVFVQTSASSPPQGFPPPLPDGKGIDLAVICVASFQYVKAYPEALLKRLQPRHVVLVHWENFFQSAEKLERKPMTVPFTNVGAFLKRVSACRNDQDSTLRWTIPRPGSRITIRY
jgi:hypothetical protein